MCQAIMKSFKSILLLTICIIVANINSARILAVYPTPSISHQLVFRRLTEELVRRGHELTVITTDPIYSTGNAPANLKEIDVHNISYNLWHNEVNEKPVGNKGDFISKVIDIQRAITKVFALQLNTNAVRDISYKRNGDYDLILMEGWVNPILILSHNYSSPVIQVSSVCANFNWKTVGAVTHPLLFPPTTQEKVYDLTLWEKLMKLYTNIVYFNTFDTYERENFIIFKQMFGPSTPDLNKLYNKVHMLLTNHHSIWIENQPVPPSTISMAGIHINTPSKLPEIDVATGDVGKTKKCFKPICFGS